MFLLRPLYDRILSHVMVQEKIFADDTTLPVLDPGRGRTKTGRLWCYEVDDRPWGAPAPPAVAFVYATDRKGERPAAHLSSFRGVLQVDGYAGFGKVVKARDDDAVALAFCWTHARRGFYEFHQGPRSRRLRPRRWPGSRGSMRSRRRSADNPPSAASRCGGSDPVRKSRRCASGWTNTCRGSRQDRNWRRRYARSCGTGRG